MLGSSDELRQKGEGGKKAEKGTCKIIQHECIPQPLLPPASANRTMTASASTSTVSTTHGPAEQDSGRARRSGSTRARESLPGNATPGKSPVPSSPRPGNEDAARSFRAHSG